MGSSAGPLSRLSINGAELLLVALSALSLSDEVIVGSTVAMSEPNPARAIRPPGTDPSANVFGGMILRLIDGCSGRMMESFPVVFAGGRRNLPPGTGPFSADNPGLKPQLIKSYSTSVSGKSANVRRSWRSTTGGLDPLPCLSTLKPLAAIGLLELVCASGSFTWIDGATCLANGLSLHDSPNSEAWRKGPTLSKGDARLMLNKGNNPRPAACFVFPAPQYGVDERTRNV